MAKSGSSLESEHEPTCVNRTDMVGNMDQKNVLSDVPDAKFAVILRA